jgi:DNA-binding NarL/FixJ family response regulator
MSITTEHLIAQTLTSGGKPTVVVVEGRALIRDCLVHCLKPFSDLDIVAVESAEEWAERCGTRIATLFIICSAPGCHLDSCYQTLDKVSQPGGAPAILLSDSADPAVIFDALQRGAKGYIPTSMSLAAAAAAMQFVGGGGVFVPVEVLQGPALQRPRPAKGFTARQMAVMDALRHGKANKIIAHELNMRESTVKVHIRKIMRKLKATNRTQVAYLSSQLVNVESI